MNRLNWLTWRFAMIQWFLEDNWDNAVWIGKMIVGILVVVVLGYFLDKYALPWALHPRGGF